MAIDRVEEKDFARGSSGGLVLFASSKGDAPKETAHSFSVKEKLGVEVLVLYTTGN